MHAGGTNPGSTPGHLPLRALRRSLSRRSGPFLAAPAHRQCPAGTTENASAVAPHATRSNQLRKAQVGDHVRRRSATKARIVFVVRRGRNTSRSTPAAPRGCRKIRSSRCQTSPPFANASHGRESYSATLSAQPDPRGLSVGACHATGIGFPCCDPIPSSIHATAQYPGGTSRCSRRSHSRPLAGLPRFNGGSASALCVSRPARRLLALWPVWSLSRPRRPFVIGVLQTMLLPPPSAPIATDWSDSCRAGFAPAEDWRLLTAHVEIHTKGSA